MAVWQVHPRSCISHAVKAARHVLLHSQPVAAPTHHRQLGILLLGEHLVGAVLLTGAEVLQAHRRDGRHQHSPHCKGSTPPSGTWPLPAAPAATAPETPAPVQALAASTHLCAL